MTDHMTTTGVLVGIKHSKTSGSLKIEIEVAKEMADEALRRLGGFPKPDVSRWVAVAVLEDQS